jgi:Spherulation-specific family 4
MARGEMGGGRCRLGIVLFFILATQGVSAGTPSHATTPSVRLAIPIDASDPETWFEAIAGAPLVGLIILNPSNGPGDGPDPSYARLVAGAQASGIIVLGYVYTQWANGNVSVSKAEGMIDAYHAWYHVDGIMLDEANDTCGLAPLSFYTTLYQYIKAEPGPAVVLLNPGKTTGECYAPISEILLTFEDDYSRYVTGYVGSAWTVDFSPSHFFHIVFDVPTVADMEAAISIAVARGAGWVYVTDLDNSNGNPYSALPTYFDQELAYVGGMDYHAPKYPSAIPVALILGLTAAGSALVVLRQRTRVPD